MIRILGLGLGFGLLLAGCGGAEGSSDESASRQSQMGEAGATSETPVALNCEAGRQIECACLNGGKGTQACADDGSRWETCECGNVTPPVPARPPSEACSEPWDIKLIPEQACPSEKPTVYAPEDCLKPYVESGACAENLDGKFICCPR